jgi:hypothetical protein
MRLGIDFVNGNSAEYHGADAEEVYAILERTGIGGGNFTGPIRLSNGISITFLLENIVSFYFTEEEPE